MSSGLSWRHAPESSDIPVREGDSGRPLFRGETEAHRRLHPGPEGESRRDFSTCLLVRDLTHQTSQTERGRKGASVISPGASDIWGRGSLQWGLPYTSQDVQQRPAAHTPGQALTSKNVSRYCHICLESETALAEPLLWPKDHPDGCDRDSGVMVWAQGEERLRATSVPMCVSGVSRSWAQQ